MADARRTTRLVGDRLGIPADLVAPLGRLPDREDADDVLRIEGHPVVPDRHLGVADLDVPLARLGVLGVLEELDEEVARVGVDAVAEDLLRVRLRDRLGRGLEHAQDAVGEPREA